MQSNLLCKCNPISQSSVVLVAAAPVKTPVKKNLSDEDDDSEEDDSEEEVQQPIKPAKQTAKKSGVLHF